MNQIGPKARITHANLKAWIRHHKSGDAVAGWQVDQQKALFVTDPLEVTLNVNGWNGEEGNPKATILPGSVVDETYQTDDTISFRVGDSKDVYDVSELAQYDQGQLIKIDYKLQKRGRSGKT